MPLQMTPLPQWDLQTHSRLTRALALSLSLYLSFPEPPFFLSPPLSAAHMLITTVCRGLSQALGTWLSAGRGEGGHWTEELEGSVPQMPCKVDKGCYREGK